MNIRFYNARILTMESKNSCFLGELWVQNERIIYVGDGKNLPATIPVWEEERDCKQNLIMPGFKNAHTHSGMTFLRSYADDLPLQEWLFDKVFPMEAKLTKEDIYDLTKLAILEYLTSGITAIFDMYITPQTIAKACEDAGMRCVQVGSINNYGPDFKTFEEEYEKYNNKHPLSSYIIGFHAEYTCSKELLIKVAEHAKKNKAPVFTHNSETLKEVNECIERYGMTPTEFLDSIGMFEYGGGGYHCVHFTENDMNIFKKHGMYVVTNPASNLKLASGIAPISEMLKREIPIAIGTDGPASNNCLDMFREMFLVTGLAKVREKDASVVDGYEVLKMATVNGAHAMNLLDSDILAPGKLADLIMIDMNQPNMQPVNNIEKNIVYSGSKQNGIMVMIHGEILYEDGRFYIDQPVNEIYEKANTIINRMKN
ncbi:MAG: amidohydrolase, partial [Clostridiales bacterium]|nr:amidohydrolase [Clostridiales bacterium]